MTHDYNAAIGAMWVLPDMPPISKTYAAPWQPSVAFISPTTGFTWGYVRVYRLAYTGAPHPQGFSSAFFAEENTPLFGQAAHFPSQFQPAHIPTEVVRWNIERLLAHVK